MQALWTKYQAGRQLNSDVIKKDYPGNGPGYSHMGIWDKERRK
jgi:hypothetical protein